MPADLSKLENTITEEEKDLKSQEKSADYELLLLEKTNHLKTHEENTLILEDSIHESIANTVAKCDELLAQGNEAVQHAYTKAMLQPPTKSERARYATNDF